MKITERGWVGHYILGSRCLFTRNTLIEHEDVKVIVSTVGNCQDYHAPGFPNEIKIKSIGVGRFFETMVFHANTTEWLDADVSQVIGIPLTTTLPKEWMEHEAQKMHEDIVEYIQVELLLGNKFPVDKYED